MGGGGGGIPNPFERKHERPVVVPLAAMSDVEQNAPRDESAEERKLRRQKLLEELVNDIEDHGDMAEVKQMITEIKQNEKSKLKSTLESAAKAAAALLLLKALLSVTTSS